MDDGDLDRTPPSPDAAGGAVGEPAVKPGVPAPDDAPARASDDVSAPSAGDASTRAPGDASVSSADDAAGPAAGVAATAAADVAVSPAVGARKRRRRTILLRSLVALVLIAAHRSGHRHLLLRQRRAPRGHRLEQATTIYYADGATPMARIGDKNRTVLPIRDIPIDVQHAVVAAQDETFYTNSGVDYSEAAGAVWNKVTGDETQGASTISQQYARQWADLEGVSYCAETA